MKKSELRQIIREEIQRLAEGKVWWVSIYDDKNQRLEKILGKCDNEKEAVELLHQMEKKYPKFKASVNKDKWIMQQKSNISDLKKYLKFWNG